MKNANWILLDTETTGFKQPIYVVEIGAQRMRGWEPDGPPFQMLLNQNADIPSEASRVHGYTREILERDGEAAEDVYEAFKEYVDDLPLVAYNNRYDLDDVLMPEWERLGIAQIGSEGFCALKLAQRLLDPVPAGNCKLQTLRQFYRLPERGAHTAMGDVETVIDLLKSVLQPIAEERNLTSWQDICDFCDQDWYPSRLNFGKFKGYDFKDAETNSELKEWLIWLSNSKKERSKAMGNWYLNRLSELNSHPSETKTSKNKSNSAPSSETGVVAYGEQQLIELKAMVASSRARLAELEAEYTKDKGAIDNLQAQIFLLVKSFYKQRDSLKLVVYYRTKYLDTLVRQGSEEADDVTEEYAGAKEDSDSEYDEAETIAEGKSALTEEQQKQLQGHWRKLVRLFHPDRYANDPERRKTYEKLTAAINAARDDGNYQLLQEIADDPKAFMQKQGWQDIDFSDESGLKELEKLYETLQIEILQVIETLQMLRESADYELLSLYEKDETIIESVSEGQKQQLEAEIEKLQDQAEELKEEIEELDPAGVDEIS